MSDTDHSRRRRAWGVAAPQHADDAPRRHRRPILRRMRSRLAAIRLNLRES